MSKSEAFRKALAEGRDDSGLVIKVFKKDRADRSYLQEILSWEERGRIRELAQAGSHKLYAYVAGELPEDQGRRAARHFRPPGRDPEGAGRGRPRQPDALEPVGRPLSHRRRAGPA